MVFMLNIMLCMQVMYSFQRRKSYLRMVPHRLQPPESFAGSCILAALQARGCETTNQPNS